MRFVKLVSTYHLDPKVSELSDAAEVAFTRSIATCGAGETGGLIPRGMLPSLIRNYTPAKGRKIAAELVECLLWETDPAGWRLRSWAKNQEELEKLLARRKADADRQKRHRENRTESRESSRDESEDVSRNSLSRARGRETRDRGREEPTRDPSSSHLPEREADEGPTTAELIERGAGRLTAPELAKEAEAFRAHNAGRWPELHDWRRAWSGWLTKATERNRPTPTPDTPTCPEHPDQPTGSKPCARCAAVSRPAPDLRKLREATREAS